MANTQALRGAFLLSALAALVLIGYGSAGTVVLSGTCTAFVGTNTSSIGFVLSNSGNDTASGMTVYAQFSGLQLTNSSRSLSVFQPGENASFEYTITNYTYPGSYAGYFLAAYTQGSQTFFAVFPCLTYVGRSANGSVYLSTTEQAGRISAKVLNEYTNNISILLQPVVPPEFGASPQNITLNLPGGSSTTAIFNLSGQPQPGSTFGAAMEFAYVLNGTHYAGLSSYVIAGAQTSGGSSLLGWISGNIPLLLVLVVVVAIAVLLALSLKRRGSRKGKVAAEVIADGAQDKW